MSWVIKGDKGPARNYPNVEHTYDGHGNRTQTDLTEALGADEQTPALKTALGCHLPEGASLTGNGRYTRSRTDTYAYDKENRLVEHRTPERGEQ